MTTTITATVAIGVYTTVAIEITIATAVTIPPTRLTFTTTMKDGDFRD